MCVGHTVPASKSVVTEELGEVKGVLPSVEYRQVILPVEGRKGRKHAVPTFGRNSNCRFLGAFKQQTTVDGGTGDKAAGAIRATWRVVVQRILRNGFAFGTKNDPAVRIG